ncbi:hypothetical protein [Staphylothermus hellenicus]|uniref:Uncharacterized protein n=1 Tax=Staphylothermus hellenicus (strain DSM 12710 / JCM 10830 / BK20S6-10-b1 / P8) TaxID=591019 RepID=D7DBS9_STAHD|nr:hypothetical protein [Staphylothermus hellenicus]ADI31626.1 hypothetical protein Shell_0495 [Staphylothermus hellenicus DSM 12710]
MPRCPKCGKIYVGDTCPYCDKPKEIKDDRPSLDELGWNDLDEIYFDPEKIEKPKIEVHGAYVQGNIYGTYIQGDVKITHGDKTQRDLCYESVLLSAKHKDYSEVLKNLSALRDYAGEDERKEIDSLIGEINFRMKREIEFDDELVERIKVLVYKVKMSGK